MPRPADKIFLRLAVDRRVLTPQDADDVWAEMVRLEGEGEAVKARVLCVEFGFMDKGLARQLKHEVRTTLERMAREESRGQRRVAGFELFEKLSSGAMGTVYKARHLKLGKVVALKLLNPDFAGDESYVARFLLEAQSAATLNHPNVVQAYDVGQTGNVHFLAMEFVEGKTLKELIKRRGAIEESAAIEIVLQILDGLRHAWEHRLVHRDVKPANIMITKEGTAKLLDLGLVRRTDQVSELTGDGRAVGTPYFMAPEQALDKGADYRADIYGLGATLFNLVTAEKPYVAGTPVAVMNMHLKAPIPDASEINRSVSKGLAQIITKMLAKRPADRYQDPARLVHDLTTVLQGFMPDLQGGETPVGLDYIAPRAEGSGESSGSRSRLGRGKSKGGTRGQSSYARRRAAGEEPGEDEEEAREPRNLLPIGLAAAAGILIGVVIFLNSGSQPKTIDTADTPEVADTDPEKEAEKQALKAYNALEKRETWGRVEALEAIAKEYGRTPTGKQARGEARDLRTTLTRAEEARYDESDRRLTEIAKEGRLREAVDGYSALHEELRVDGLKTDAKRRADELLGLLEQRSSAAAKEADKLEKSGHERQAAEIRRRRAELFLGAEERKQEETRAEALVKKADDRDKATAQEREKERLLERQKEEAKVAALPAGLVMLIKEGELEAALARATEVSNSVTQAEFRTRAQVHVQALEAIRRLDGLALAALKEKGVGTTVMFMPRKGSNKISGDLVSVEDGILTIKVQRGAMRSVRLEDLAEDVTWKWVRKGEGRDSEPYLRGVTSLKLYRADEDALEWLQTCQEANVDLSPLVAELRRVEGEKKPVATGGGEPTDPQPAGAPRKKTPEEVAAEMRAEQERVKALIARRNDVFREADDVGYEGAHGRLEGVYRYFQEGREFKNEWRLIRGEASPTPRGQIERQGLRLMGRDGRAEFFAPMVEGLEFRLRFLNFGTDRRGRLSIVLEGEKGRRVIANFGGLEYRVKRRRKLVQGQSQIDNMQRGEIEFHVRREGRFIISKIGTDETARIELPEDEDLGTYRLAIEWGRVSVSILTLRVLCKPEAKWLDKRLER